MPKKLDEKKRDLMAERMSLEQQNELITKLADMELNCEEFKDENEELNKENQYLKAALPN